MASNGRLDLSTLTKVPLSSDGFGYLENFTAQGWFAAREDLIRTTGTIPILIADGLYRDYSRQVYWKQYWTRLGKPNNAATPGTSNHGLGTAVDVNNISAYNQKTLDTVMARHGFVRDTSESWHYHHISNNPADSGATPIPAEQPKEKKDMYLKFDTNGAGYLVTDEGTTSLTFQEFNLFVRLINADPKTVSAGQDPFLVGEFAIVDAVLERIKTPVNIDALATALAAKLPAQTGSFTPTDRAMLDDIANKGELGAALTNTVNAVNSHADANKAQIIQEIDTHSGSSLSAFTATITPVD